MVKLLVLGASGAMGKLISKLALDDKDIEIVAAVDINHIGQLLGNLVGAQDPNDIKIRDSAELEKIIKETNPDVAVDFTIATATERNCEILVKSGVRCVIGTTMLSSAFLKNFEQWVEENKAPAVISSNMATGVNILFKMASVLATYLNDWDIEIIEAHHHRKADAPSGTAMTLAHLICESIGADLEKVAKYGRDKGPNKRQVGAKKEIGINAVRAGDIIGDHTILYAGPGERIELKHQAHSRNCFASGSITAIKFIANAKENKIYSTAEVLGL
ncbi:MAG: 4-hydroxy-tetrahydrodipicolinate reductase [Promethearchaeota archaeon]